MLEDILFVFLMDYDNIYKIYFIRIQLLVYKVLDVFQFVLYLIYKMFVLLGYKLYLLDENIK